MPKLGIINDIWSIGSHHVVRIPTQVEFVPLIQSESIAVPTAVKAGIRTPRVVAYDDDRDILPVPYLIFERVRAVTLGTCPKSPTWEFASSEWSRVLYDLGGQLAMLHTIVTEVNDPMGRLNPWWVDDPIEALGEGVDRGVVCPEEARWVEAFVERLRTAFSYDPAGPCDRRVFVHHDVHPWNVMVLDNGADTAGSTVLLDWGNACWGDPAVDFCGFPFWALPNLVDAYRSWGGGPGQLIEGRILWMWLALALSEPLHLDSSLFSRHWWRLPEGGLQELQYRLLLLPDAWRQWAV